MVTIPAPPVGRGLRLKKASIKPTAPMPITIRSARIRNQRPRLTGWPDAVTVIALVLFALQTAFLDPFVWPAFFSGG